MVDETVGLVAEFFEAFDLDVPAKPDIPNADELAREVMRQLAERMANVAHECWRIAALYEGQPCAALFTKLQLIQEELSEFALALARNNLAACLHELTDLQYVVDNGYVALGLHPLKMLAFRAVHGANMTKLISCDAAGRILKGPSFKPANMEEVLEAWRLSKLTDDRPQGDASTDASSEESCG